jgi:hypothetical protein
MYLDANDNKKVKVCVAGKTTLVYDRRAINDLYNMLKDKAYWVKLWSGR